MASSTWVCPYFIKSFMIVEVILSIWVVKGKDLCMSTFGKNVGSNNAWTICQVQSWSLQYSEYIAYTQTILSINPHINDDLSTSLIKPKLSILDISFFSPSLLVFFNQNSTLFCSPFICCYVTLSSLGVTFICISLF